MVKITDMSTELKKELAFTKEELEELEMAKKKPITFDSDCPETTPEFDGAFRSCFRTIRIKCNRLLLRHF